MVLRTSVTIAMAHRLQQYQGLCKNIHGHNWTAHVEVYGPLQLNGMVMDFSDFKQVVREELKRFDHCTLLQENDPFANVLREHNMRLHTTNFPPTTETFAEALHHVFGELFEDPMALIAVEVHETANNIVRVTAAGKARFMS